MNKKTALKGKVQTSSKKIRDSINSFKSQLSLNKSAACAHFQKSKKELQLFLKKEVEPKIDKLKSLNQEEKKKLKSQYDDLWVQLALGKAQTKQNFEQQRKKIEKSLRPYCTAISKVTRNQYRSVAKKMHDSADKFSSKMQTYGWQFALWGVKTQKERQVKKEEIEKKITNLNRKMQLRRNIAGLKAENFLKHFSKEINVVKDRYFKRKSS